MNILKFIWEDLKEGWPIFVWSACAVLALLFIAWSITL